MPARILEDPIGDPQWAAILERHPSASVFHTPGWLNALRRTYGYQPLVVTASPGATLDSGVVVCRVNSWLTRRLVSVPFADHCDPLVSSAGDFSEMFTFLKSHARGLSANSIELRPTLAATPLVESATGSGELQPDANYYLHRLDLRADGTELFRKFHHSSTQRAIRRAEREQLTYENGTSIQLLASFYRLLRMARRRHGLPPQPIAWFRNLIACLGERVMIHVASKNGQPIASIMTLSFKQTMVYKYGGSDAAHHRLGGMPFLFWRAIQDAKLRGFTQLDLGRSDLDQPGLIAFKNHLGAAQSLLTYYRYPARKSEKITTHWMSHAVRRIFAHLPDPALDAAGRILYKHLG